ncbi:MAG: hypothetical protein ACTS73_04065 [Arsenophonus sp. NEOnobi-MAG3]
MICHEKSTLQISAKSNITYDPFHKLIRNGASQLIVATATLMLS